MYIILTIFKHCTPVFTYSDQEQEDGGGFGGGGFDLGFFGGLLHSPLGNFVRLRCSLHPYLQVGLSRLLLLLGGCGGVSVILLCRGNTIDDTCELPITANLK